MSCITEPVVEPVSSIVAPLPTSEASMYSLDRGVVMNRLRPFHSRRSETASSKCCRTPGGSVNLASQENPGSRAPHVSVGDWTGVECGEWRFGGGILGGCILYPTLLGTKYQVPGAGYQVPGIGFRHQVPGTRYQYFGHFPASGTRIQPENWGKPVKKTD